MNVLFLHTSFPAQFERLAVTMAREGHTVVYGSARPEGSLPGVHKILFKPHREAAEQTHAYGQAFEKAILNGQAVYRALKPLKDRGFKPEIVVGHSGWGPTLFIKDLFPDARLLCYYEWFYHAEGTDADFLPESPLTENGRLRIRAMNAPILMDLCFNDWGWSPTEWQRWQFPEKYRSGITVLHDGVDTDFFAPAPGSKLILKELDLSHTDELITYVARGMEPYRGFPQFIQAASIIQKRRPKAHIVVVGKDRVAYGRQLPDGKTYKEKMLEETELDPSRIHFTGLLPYGEYKKVIQASAVHVYLTVPFVLSWSMIETMSVGGLVLGSDTPPVREVIRDGQNGLLVDFFSPERIADRVDEVLDHPNRMAEIRQRARATVLDRYDARHLLVCQRQLIRDVAEGRLAQPV